MPLVRVAAPGPTTPTKGRDMTEGPLPELMVQPLVLPVAKSPFTQARDTDGNKTKQSINTARKKQGVFIERFFLEINGG
jgi:hypothetical protein